MNKLNPYLNFQGNTEEAFNFYRSVFGGEFEGGIKRFRDMPGNDLPEEDQDKIMHIALPVGSSHLMGTDALESLGQKVNFGNNSYICIQPDSKEEADRIFKALSEGGEIEMPLEDQEWGDYFGSFTDKFGVQWMIVY